VKIENLATSELFCDSRLANTETWHLIPPADFNMRIPDSIRKCVVYLGVEVIDGDSKRVAYKGTGFLLGVPGEKIPGGSFGYLATAKHVAVQFEGRNFYIRVNLKEGKSVDVVVAKDSVQWYFHPTDSGADVAVCRFQPSSIVDYLGLPTPMILTEATRKLKGIGAGDQVFVTGLFVYHSGNAKNIPIIRMGNIAMTPDERIQTTLDIRRY